MEQFLLGLVEKYPVMMSVAAGIGVFRLVFKPAMSFLHAVAEATPTQKDNAALAKFESGKAYKSLVWIVDYLLSVKLPVKK